MTKKEAMQFPKTIYMDEGGLSDAYFLRFEEDSDKDEYLSAIESPNGDDSVILAEYKLVGIKKLSRVTTFTMQNCKGYEAKTE